MMVFFLFSGIKPFPSTLYNAEKTKNPWQNTLLFLSHKSIYR